MPLSPYFNQNINHLPTPPTGEEQDPALQPWTADNTNIEDILSNNGITPATGHDVSSDTNMPTSSNPPQDNMDTQSIQKLALQAYLAKWKAAQDVKAPDTKKYKDAENFRQFQEGMEQVGNTIANIKDYNPYDSSKQFAAQRAIDKQSMKADQDTYLRTKQDGAAALDRIPGLAESIESDPLKKQLQNEQINKIQNEQQYLDSAVDDLTKLQIQSGLKNIGIPADKIPNLENLTYRQLAKNSILTKAVDNAQKKYQFQTIQDANGEAIVIAVDPSTGKQALDNNGKPISIGNKGYRPQVRTDPLTGNIVRLQGGKLQTLNATPSQPNSQQPIQNQSTPTQQPGQQQQTPGQQQQTPAQQSQPQGRTFQQLNPNERKYVVDQQKQFANERVKLQDGQQALDNANNDINMATTNAAAANSLIIQLNRLAGDKGPIRADEFAMFKGDPSVLNQLQRVISTHVDGQVITPKDKVLLQQLLTSYGHTFNLKKQNLTDMHLNQLRAKVPNADESLLGNIAPSTQQPAQQNKVMNASDLP